jgi:hypothetical protein
LFVSRPKVANAGIETDYAADVQRDGIAVHIPGEMAMVMPPAEIHSFTALEEETFIFTIVGGNYSATRHYYNADAQTYVLAQAGRQPKAA